MIVRGINCRMNNIQYSDDTMVQLASLIARLAHQGQFDEAGQPYYNHPEKVAGMLTTPLLKTIGFLHDVLEDTAMEEKDLRLLFPDEVVDAVVVMTHREDEPYEAYIRRVGENQLARQVKLADLTHNMDLSRLKKITKYALDRKKNRYMPAFEYLVKL